MCVICLKKEEASVTEEEILKMWEANDDGAGYCFVNDGKLILRKGYMNLKSFLKQWNKDTDKFDIGKKKVLLHFRIGTHGLLCSSNTHPFSLSDKMVFAHNGTFWGFNIKNGDKNSDTAMFAKVLRKLPPNWIDCGTIKETIESYSTTSKLCFLKANGEHWISHEDKGTWDNGRWFSNMIWKNRAIAVYSGSYNNYDDGYGEDDYYLSLAASRADANAAAISGNKNIKRTPEGWCQCDLCETYVDEEHIKTIGTEVQFCYSCYYSMTVEERNIYLQCSNASSKDTTENDKDELSTVQCPTCKVQYVATKEEADDGIWCPDCHLLFDKAGEIQFG